MRHMHHPRAQHQPRPCADLPGHPWVRPVGRLLVPISWAARGSHVTWRERGVVHLIALEVQPEDGDCEGRGVSEGQRGGSLDAGVGAQPDLWALQQ